MSSRKQIGNTLTITTMDDPVSVQAQYSPDKVTVHTTWQNGDLYMRTRESDDVSWSSWHKIVGESGDETDFSFGISQYKTTANASTAPSDISSWSDAPLAVTTAKPYLWAKVQQKSWNASTQSYVVDSTRYIRLTGEDGHRGKVGRFFYYAGIFDVSDTTTQFIVNDAQSPFFAYNNQYWVYNPEDNPSGGTTTMSAMGAPSSSSSSWNLMTDDFKYIITEAIFGKYAHFGSFIINGDWLISQHGTINGSSSTSYTKFYPEFIHGCSLCKSFDVDVNYIIAGSAYFIGGKTYYIKVSGSSFSSGCQLNVRMYNGSSNVGTTLNLTSSSPSGTITFEPTTSGTYYLRADCQSGGMTAKLTAYVDCFVPNYAVDGSSGKTYQTQIYASGGLRSPFTYMTSGGSFTTDFNDNVAVYSGSETSYSLPWDASQSGRKVVITNYYWNGNYSTSSGFAKITAPSGKYFYEDGITKSTLKLSREAVELLGYGDENNFYGWLVLKRIDLGTANRYGHHMKMLASGRVIGSSSGASVSYHTFDDTTMSVTRDGEGIYTLSWSNNNWFGDAGHVFAMVCGYGVVDGGSNPLYASVKSQTKTSITVQTADDDTLNDGSFNFILMNFNDWIYL